MPFTYKTVLIVGATSGIGLGMAEKFVAEGVKVIVSGRRQEKLDEFVQKHGSAKAGAIRFDITDTAGLDGFVDKAFADYPDLDCVLLNAGIQSRPRLSRAAEFDFAGFHNEINVNFTCIVNLSMKFLPRLQAKSEPTGLIITGTHLGLVPAPTLAAYSASKAALTAFVDCLREQNRHKPTKIVEIYPPVVKSELHDYLGEKIGRSFGMEPDVFAEQTYNELLKGEDLVVIGSIATEPRDSYMELVDKRRTMFKTLTSRMMAHFEL